MFAKHHTLKLFVGIAVAASIAVVGARAAKAGTPYNPNAYVVGGASQTVAQAMQDVGFGSTREVSVNRRQQAAKVQFRLITDTLGGNGRSKSHPAAKVKSKVESIRIIPDVLGGTGHPQLPLQLQPGRTLDGNGRAVA